MNVNDLPFQIQSTIFFLAQNPNLATVSKNFHEVALDPSTIIHCFSKWKNPSKDFCCYLCKYKRMYTNKNLMMTIVNKDLNFCKKFRSNNRILNYSLREGWTDVTEVILNKTKLIQSSNPSESGNLKTLYKAIPLFQIQFINWYEPIFSEKLSYKSVIQLENAHKIQVDILKQHNISKDDMIDGETNIHIHPKLGKNIYVGMLRCSIKANNLKNISHILNSYQMDKKTFENIMRVVIETENTELFDYFVKYGKSINLEASFDYLARALSYKKLKIISHLITTNINLDDTNVFDTLFKSAFVGDSLDGLLFLIEKGAKLSSIKDEDIKLAVKSECQHTLIYYVQQIGMENLPPRTIRMLIKSRNYSLKNRLLDLGLDPRINKDFLLHSTLIHYNPYTDKNNHEEIECYIKKLLDGGCDVYARKSKILKHCLLYMGPKIINMILNKGKKPHPGMEKAFFELGCENKVEIARLMLTHNKDVYPELGKFLYKQRSTLNDDMIKLFVGFGAGNTEPYGMGIIKYAINKKNIKLANSLMEYEILLDYKDLKFFRDVVSIGCTSVVEKYLQNEEFVNTDLDDEFIYACRRNNHAVVHLFLKYTVPTEKFENRKRKRAASSNIKVSSLANIRNGKPLEVATKNENMEMINILLEYGAKITPKNKNLFLDSIKYENIDAMNHYLGILDVKNKVHRDIIGEGLYQAILYSHFKNVKNISRNVKNDILQQACNVGNIEYAIKAIEMGADVNGIEPRTFCKAYISNRTDIFDLLIENGIEKERIEECRFIKTCVEGNFDKVKEMASKELDLNVYDGLILKQAGKSCNIKIINLLLSKGAKPEKIIWNAS
ncbi:hypothetical protein BB559_002960 [Furculomyces boomerangus]|uniref:Uncharacterized protein n=1 Tax=Furculomyces boomerangus TaxID=61424 RepID=A0A2T9YQK7_9FUNG|nr:hypothetical protein BB559_002960 [Furculomyces boomerangus]